MLVDYTYKSKQHDGNSDVLSILRMEECERSSWFVEERGLGCFRVRSWTEWFMIWVGPRMGTWMEMVKPILIGLVRSRVCKGVVRDGKEGVEKEKERALFHSVEGTILGSGSEGRGSVVMCGLFPCLLNTTRWIFVSLNIHPSFHLFSFCIPRFE
jgi:hypothetical protein